MRTWPPCPRRSAEVPDTQYLQRAIGASIGVCIGVSIGVCIGVSIGVCIGAIIGVFIGASIGVCIGVSIGVCICGSVYWRQYATSRNRTRVGGSLLLLLRLESSSLHAHASWVCVVKLAR